MKLLTALVAVAALLTGVLGDNGIAFGPTRPPSYPLAVKSPYLSAWLPAGSARDRSGMLAGTYPNFWTDRTLGWMGMVRVDGEVYNWMGHLADDYNVPHAEQTAAEYTATTSYFTFNITGKIELTAAFLSPVYPHDFKRQSLVFSYLNVYAKSLDGALHDVQIYSDITGEWVAASDSSSIKWDSGTQGDVKYHRIYKETQLAFSEDHDLALWGDWFYATTASQNMTYSSGASDTESRKSFMENGVLANTNNTNYRAIKDDWPVFGFAVDLGSVGDSPKGTTFTIGLAQEKAAQLARINGVEEVPSLWTTYFKSGVEALEFFHNDFSHAVPEMTKLHNQILTDSLAVAGSSGPEYGLITTLAFRQAFAGTQLAGTTDRAYLFMKEISSNGNFQTVDVFFPMHPILLYTNPTLLKLVMDPVFEYQEAGLYPNKYSLHDLGSHYPNATGHPKGDDEAMPLEECGNMIIMALAYAQRANDTEYLEDHFPILKQWAQYLIDKALYPEHQLSTDDFAGPLANQANLALKGIVGLHAMSEIANLTGHDFDAQKYHVIADLYTQKWEELAINKKTFLPHAVLSYGDPHSRGLLYNLYADRELGLNRIPQEVYDIQSDWYPAVRNKFGVPLDTRGPHGMASWQMFSAAIAKEKTRNLMVHDLAKWVYFTPTDRPMPDLFNIHGGGYSGFAARPVIGGVFALLALQK